MQISSLAGIGALPGNSAYAGAKWALEGMTESVRQEVADFGIRCILVEPAGFRTDLASGVVMAPAMPEYELSVGPQRRRFSDGAWDHADGDPERAAQALLELVDRADAPRRLIMGASAYETATAIWRDRLAEAEAWQALSRSLAFPDP